MTRLLSAALCIVTLAACGRSEVNPPTEPAQPLEAPTKVEPKAPPPPPGMGPLAPGAGPQNFVGRWAADVAWCPNTQGAEQAIEITSTRLDGYENSCAIASIDQQGDGYVASLICSSEGVTNRERVRFVASGQTLRMTYLDRDAAVVNLAKCTTLGDTTPTGPSLGSLMKKDGQK